MGSASFKGKGEGTLPRSAAPGSTGKSKNVVFRGDRVVLPFQSPRASWEGQTGAGESANPGLSGFGAHLVPALRRFL